MGPPTSAPTSHCALTEWLKGWARTFDEPIKLPNGGKLFTLKQAIAWLAKEVPKAEHDAAEWQAAMESLLLVVESGGPTMFARIGVMRAFATSNACSTPIARVAIGDGES